LVHTAESLQAAFKYLFPDEVKVLKELAQSLPGNPVVVNIGAGAGTSGLAFMESRSDLRLITIDIQKEDSPFGCLEAEENILREAGLWNDRVIHKQGNSYDIGNHWLMANIYDKHWLMANVTGFDYGLVDMVFIDGDHNYVGCSGDIIAWRGNIKSGGIIAVHDYKKGQLFENDEDYQPDKPHPKPWPGVDKAVDELLVGRFEQILRVDSLIAFRV